MNKEVALYDNSTIGKKSALVLGEAVLVLTAGTEDHKKLKNGDEITHEAAEVVVRQASKRVAIRFIEHARISWDHRKLAEI